MSTSVHACFVPDEPDVSYENMNTNDALKCNVTCQNVKISNIKTLDNQDHGLYKNDIADSMYANEISSTALYEDMILEHSNDEQPSNSDVDITEYDDNNEIEFKQRRSINLLNRENISCIDISKIKSIPDTIKKEDMILENSNDDKISNSDMDITEYNDNNKIELKQQHSINAESSKEQLNHQISDKIETLENANEIFFSDDEDEISHQNSATINSKHESCKEQLNHQISDKIETLDNNEIFFSDDEDEFFYQLGNETETETLINDKNINKKVSIKEITFNDYPLEKKNSQETHQPDLNQSADNNYKEQDYTSTKCLEDNNDDHYYAIQPNESFQGNMLF